LEPAFLVQFETSLYFQIILIVEREVVKLVFALFHYGFGLDCLGLEWFKSEFETLVLLEEETVIGVVGDWSRLIPQSVGL
jgi:hypothetical protein